jgi:hypothetical protein
MIAERGRSTTVRTLLRTLALTVVVVALFASAAGLSRAVPVAPGVGAPARPVTTAGVPAGTAAPIPSANFTGPGNWTEQTDYGAASGTSGTGGLTILGNSCVTNGTFVYCVGGQNQTGTDLSDVFYANVSSAGVIGPWMETTDYGAASGHAGAGGVGIEFTSCVAYLGYIFCVGGALSVSPFIVSDVFYAPLSSSGVGAWTETTDYGAASGSSGTGGDALFNLACAESGGYVYCAGGATPKVFYAALSSSGVGAWTETTDYGAASGSTGTGGVSVEATSCVTNNSYLYCVGGNTPSPSSKVFFAPVSSSGVGAWSESTDYGAASGSSGTGGVAIFATACFVYSGWVICVDGDNATFAALDDVFYAPLSAAGVGTWSLGGGFGDAYFFSYHLWCVELREYGVCGGGARPMTYSAPMQPTTKHHTSLATSFLTSSATAGSTFVDTATLTGATATAGGTVYYSLFSNQVCSGINTALSDVTVTKGIVPNSQPFTATLTSSAYMSVRASYNGDPNNAASVASCEPIHVLAQPILTTKLSKSAAVVGGSFDDVATLTGATATAGGTINFIQNEDQTCTTPTGATDAVSVLNGQPADSGTFFTVPTSTGYNSIEVSYTGDPNNAPAGPVCEPIPIVTAVKPVVTITCTPDAVTVGSPTTCTITVTGTMGSVAGDMVALSSESTTGTFSPKSCTLNAQGSCTVTYTDSAAGFPTLTAKFLGDSYNAPASSTTVVGNLPQNPFGSASTSTSTSGGGARADQTSSSQVSVTISGSTAPDGTSVTIFSARLASALPGTPAFTWSNPLGAYDVKVAGIADGTALVCISNSAVNAATEVAYVTGGSWVAASANVATAGTKVCGSIPVADLQGTPVNAGDPPASPSTSTHSSGLSSTEELALVAGLALVVVIAVAVLMFRRRGRAAAAPPSTDST